ncbi:major facilitator superfamily domain-containing protein [Rhodocollybia butyracea]|uniref:Major facilitator superfamily domain-containing protein n=1 Tax=Rhodocollybia butyracea TaxID=206335 RepID=A0A9P5Q0N7_9AGAR|nr:major facilitator superfamily domain-containing protein [Rhodocollybia butyracea]
MKGGLIFLHILNLHWRSFTVSRGGTPPYGLKWRSSYWFVTFVVALGCIGTDLLVYSIIIPVIPFQLEKLGYTAISVRTSWLLFSYSAGLAVSTIPVAILSERHDTRRAPLLLGILVLIGSQIMLMEAPVYWLLCLARILQGIGSTMVWVVGLALLCDTTPKNLIGRQLGLSMTGMSIGQVNRPPVGGALYSRFGFRGPCIFGIITAVLDFVGRLVVIERKEALYWGHDTLAVPESAEPDVFEPPVNVSSNPVLNSNEKNDVMSDDPSQSSNTTNPSISLLAVILELAKSSRAITATLLTFIYAVLYTCIEPTLPLRMQASWGFDSSKVGLVFLAAVIPTFIVTVMLMRCLLAGPVSGLIADRYGTSWITVISFVCSLPWWGLLIINGNLPLFIASFALSNFCLSGAISPLMAELAAVSRNIDGVGYAHVYAAFNLAYGIGAAVGPIVGGQVYYQIKQGWMALCLLAVGLTSLGLLLSFFFIGEETVFRILLRCSTSRRRAK